MNTELALNIIRSTLKEKIIDTKIYDKTWGNIVIEINNKWIFRFPKSKESEYLLEKEIIFLKEFSSKSPINIPSIIIHKNNFILYKKIMGIALTPMLFESLSSREKEDIAKDLASFLLWLHKTNFKHKKIPISECPNKKNILEKINAISTKLSLIAKENLLKYFDNSDLNVFAKNKNTLIHNDLGEGNIIINNGKVTGIIDFGRLMYGQSELDFAKIWRNFGKDFAEQVLTFCSYNRKKIGLLYIYDLFNRENPFIEKIEEIFG